MSGYPLSTGEAVQAVLEGRECESEGDGNWRMRLIGDEPRIATSSANSGVVAVHRYIRWRLVPSLVKREEALRALAEGKTIRRGHAVFSGGFEPWRHSAVVILAEAMFDDTACWEILS